MKTVFILASNFVNFVITDEPIPFGSPIASAKSLIVSNTPAAPVPFNNAFNELVLFVILVVLLVIFVVLVVIFVVFVAILLIFVLIFDKLEFVFGSIIEPTRAILASNIAILPVCDVVKLFNVVIFPALVFPVVKLVLIELVCDINVPSAVFILVVNAFISESFDVIFNVFVFIFTLLLFIAVSLAPVFTCNAAISVSFDKILAKFPHISVIL